MEIQNISSNAFYERLFTIIFVLSFFFFVFKSANAQEINLKEINFNKVKQKSNTTDTLEWSDFLKDSPVQLGLEAGTSFLRRRDYYYLSTCFIGSLDINLYNKVAFLRLEIGRLYYIFNEFTRISLGPNFKIYKTGKSRFFISAGASIDFGNRGFIGTLEASLRYVYLVSEVFGVSASIRYPYWNTDSSRPGDPIIGIGIQLFTK
jgi:hypothetical protein